MDFGVSGDITCHVITSVKTLGNFQKIFYKFDNKSKYMVVQGKKTVLSCRKILEEENVIHLNSRGKVDVDDSFRDQHIKHICP